MRPLYSIFCLWLFSAFAQGATVHFTQTAVNDSDGSSFSAVISDRYLTTATTYQTLTAPASFQGMRFTHWTVNSYSSTVYRDAWGRSLNPISLNLLEDTNAVAHYLPENLDSDGDGIPDWYEIEYFGNLSHHAADDSDADSITLLAEYNNGTHSLYKNSSLEGGISSANSALVTCNLASYPTYIIRDTATGTVTQTAIVLPGTVIKTADLGADPTFGFWTVNGVRQQDAWGIAYPQITLTLTTANQEAVAHFFVGDSDGDGIPDAYEYYFFDGLGNDAQAITSGDGISLLTKYANNSNPIFGAVTSPGGVSWSDSVLITCNLLEYPSYTIRSAPAGTGDTTAFGQFGQLISTPDMANNPNFGYWMLDGIRQQDAWGVARSQINFNLGTTNREAVAYFFSGDSDNDGIPDAYEYYYFGDLLKDSDSATNSDGVSLFSAYTAGANPIFARRQQEGGISWVDTDLITANLQPYNRPSKLKFGGVLTDFFSANPSAPTGLQLSSASSVAVTDFDGDGVPDLFIAGRTGLRVYHNIGTAHNPDFEEVSAGFEGLATLLASIDHPVIAGGDWNGDGKGDLVIGGNTNTLYFVASTGTWDFAGATTTLIVDSTAARPALGDINGDGYTDLLVLLADGSTRLYLNTGLDVPFSGEGTSNFLGTIVPDGISITTGDIDQDGLLDVLLSDTAGRISEFVRNPGGSGFTLRSKVWGGTYNGFAAGLILTAVDLEGDGNLDMIAGLENGALINLRDGRVGRPIGVVATPGAASIRLDWDANTTSRIRGYNLYRSLSAVGPWEKLNADIIPLPTYIDATVARGIAYYYHVRGVSYFYQPGNSVPQMDESLPSDVMAAGSGKVRLCMRRAHGHSGRIMKINLSLEHSTGVSGKGLLIEVAYDGTKLQPLAKAQGGHPSVLPTALSKHISFTDNGATASGELVITGTDGFAAPGEGKFLTLQFRVNPDVADNEVLSASIKSASIQDLAGNVLQVETTVLEQPESSGLYVEGDVNGDGIVNADDQALLKELIKPKFRAPTTSELIAADLNGDGRLDEKDLVLLIRLLKGKTF